MAKNRVNPEDFNLLTQRISRLKINLNKSGSPQKSRYPIETRADAFLVDRRPQDLAKGSLRLYYEELQLFMKFCRIEQILDIYDISPDLLRRYLLYIEGTGHNPAGIHMRYPIVFPSACKTLPRALAPRKIDISFSGGCSCRRAVVCSPSDRVGLTRILAASTSFGIESKERQERSGFSEGGEHFSRVPRPARR